MTAKTQGVSQINAAIRRGVRGIVQAHDGVYGYVGPHGIAMPHPDAFTPFSGGGPGGWCVWNRYDPHRESGHIEVLASNLDEDDAMALVYGIKVKP